MSNPPRSAALSETLAKLDELINWERRKRSSAAAMRLSIEPASDLTARLGSPHERLRTVHVTGTKGKGSTASLIAAGLTRAGFSTALYTSPHVERVQERLRIDGREVFDELLATHVERALAARAAAIEARTPGEDATWFDLVTAACFAAAEAAGARWLVAEVGIGGRLDSTNVVHGEVCVITSIELEHTAILGSTREAIAFEKAGILKRGSSLVTGVAANDPAGRVIDRIASELDVRVVRPEYVGLPIAERNLSLARAALDELGRRGVLASDGRTISREVLDATAIAHAALPGRLESFEFEGVHVVIDGAHVAESVRDVLVDLERDPRRRGKIVSVVGMGRDKDLSAILKTLAPRVERVICTSVGTELHFSPEEIAGEAQKIGMAVETTALPSAALERAVELVRDATEHAWVLVIGSLYLAGAVRPILLRARTKSRC